MNRHSEARLGAGFWALFSAQFCGAFNDNLFKTALAVSISFRALALGGLEPTVLVAVCGGLLILPFALFSALAGQLSDRYPKHRLLRLSKAVESGIMLFAGASMLAKDLPLCLASLFLLGAQAAFFGPLKYGALPELLPEPRLVAGNAWVELGTFVAVLLGTIAGGMLASSSPLVLAVVVEGVALLGYLAVRRVPPLEQVAPGLPLDLNWLRSNAALIRIARRDQVVFHAILGISWFWLLGAVVLSLLPELVRVQLGGGPAVVTFLLAAFSVGVGLGALLCERLSFDQVELGVVPLGAVGLSVFLAALGCVAERKVGPHAARSLMELLSTSRGVAAAVCTSLLALAGGLFTVPLYALLQQRARPAERARVVAANNVVNALFMVVGSVGLAALAAAGVSTARVLVVLSVLNLAVAAYTYRLAPTYLFRFLCWALARLCYRLKIVGAAQIPREGAAVLVSNHVTFVDWLLISAATQRPIRFVMHHGFLALPLSGRLFRDAKVIPIASAKQDAALLEQALQRIAEELRAGELVCLFPEGRLTRDGNLGCFQRGIERIIAASPVPVLPLALSGLWGSFFSRYGKGALRRPFRRVWSRVTLNVGAPLSPNEVSAERLEGRVAELLSEGVRPARSKRSGPSRRSVGDRVVTSSH